MTADPIALERAIREAAGNASPGPWATCTPNPRGKPDTAVVRPAGDAEIGTWWIAAAQWSVDAAYIALASPSAVVSVLDAKDARIAGLQANVLFEPAQLTTAKARIAELETERDGWINIYDEARAALTKGPAHE